MKKFLFVFAMLGTALLILAVSLLNSASVPQTLAQKKSEVVPNNYIVVLKKDTKADEVADDMAKTHGLKLKHVYKNALRGYTAEIPADKLDKVKKDKRVLFVTQDREISIDIGGDGLKGEYYDNKDFTNLKVTRVDPTVNFNWRSGSPASGIGSNTFSVRWTGQVEAQTTETYTFYARTDDGVRLWVDNVLIIDQWVDQSATELSGEIALVAGQKYNITMEYYENTGRALAQLRWSTPTIAKQIIPQSQLFSSTGVVPTPTPTVTPTPTATPTPTLTPTPTSTPTPTPTTSPSTQTVPTGVSRIGVNGTNNGSGIAVAVLDTGIELAHPDLASNVVANKNCVDLTKNGNDDNGHGTHVAGTIAGINNTLGVVGVANNAKLVAVKVLNAGGSGTWSGVICGIDWITANASLYNIKVANMSLGGGGGSDNNCGNSNDDALHYAICNSTQAGVTYVVSAGNSNANASNYVPASYDDTVITVSALADSDGQPGGLSSGTVYGADDTFASFSNYGSVVDLGAPGVSINSTYLNGGYTKMSGTSMSSPHVAGSAALYIKSNPGASWTQVRDALKTVGEVLGSGHTDPSGLHPEPIVRANTL